MNVMARGKEIWTGGSENGGESPRRSTAPGEVRVGNAMG